MWSTARSSSLSLLALVASAAWSTPERDHVELVNKTPCLYEYRQWYFAMRQQGVFVVPEGFTADQCARAREVHEDIQREQAFRAVQREEAARAAEDERRRQGDLQLRAVEAEKSRLDAEHEALMRQLRAAEARRRAAAAVLASKPGVRLGMTTDDVLNRSNWGRPLDRSRVTTASGVTEHWHYSGGNYLRFEDGKLVLIKN